MPAPEPLFLTFCLTLWSCFQCPLPTCPSSLLSVPLALAPLSQKCPSCHSFPFRTCLNQSHQCLSIRWPPWGHPAASSSTTASPRLSGMASSSSPPSTLRSPSPTMSASWAMMTPPSLPDTLLSATSLWRCSSSWVRPSAPPTRAGGIEGTHLSKPHSILGLQDPGIQRPSISGSLSPNGPCAQTPDP